MCGIAALSGHFAKGLLSKMSESIAHRGPDGDGEWNSTIDGVHLAHRRLSIIDVSDDAAQPMWDATRTVAIVFNGEIYNYRQLRAALVADGFSFRNKSDTEVLLNLYLRDGEEALQQLNGIFAFALWDTRFRSLLLARDGLGVKPLYYARIPAGMAFASELKALMHVPDIDRSIDPVAVTQHLTHLWCPAPHTMLRGVKKFLPGQAMRVVGGNVVKSWQFYELPFDQELEPMSVASATEQTFDALQRAVARQMVADVPVGAFLSGGLDSSSLVALAQRERQRHGGDARMQCFTIELADTRAWREAEGSVADLPYAERVAKHLDVDLHKVVIGSDAITEHLETTLFHLDEPQADPAPIQALLISRLAREHGIKVLLSGAGGDDLFTGYRRHFALRQERWWSWLPRPARACIAAAAERLPGRPTLLRRVGKAFRNAGFDRDQRIAGYFQWLPTGLVQTLLAPALTAETGPIDPRRPLLASLRSLPETTAPLNRMLCLELRHFLADHNLNYTDKTGMAAGVEVRVPFLDPDLVELAARLPVRYKQHGRVGKWILKKAMEPLLPRDVVYRPKTGFGAPLRAWLRGPLKAMADDILAPAALQSREIFDPVGVEALRRADAEGRVDGAYPIFAILCIELWCRTHLDRELAVDLPRSAAGIELARQTNRSALPTGRREVARPRSSRS